jgi:hypothetical protein
MTKNQLEDAAREDRSRLQSFLDCVARLLARRWILDERQRQDDLPNENEETDGEPSRV